MLYEIDVRLKLSKVQINKLTNKPINVITEKGKRSMLCITCCLFGELDWDLRDLPCTTILRKLTQILSWRASAAVKDFSGMLCETD